MKKTKESKEDYGNSDLKEGKNENENLSAFGD